MKTKYGHLTYCTNIHKGESWPDHFQNIQKSIPAVKAATCPHQPFGIGLRLSNEASLQLANENILTVFKKWLAENDCYVFTVNGFPYGGFHNEVVKDKVHSPDWTTTERLDYTTRIANLLVELLPSETDGGISTSPLSYRHWFKTEAKKTEAVVRSTENIITLVAHLWQVKKDTGKYIHLDIEPEPDGLLENGTEFIHWYEHRLLPMGINFLKKELDLSDSDAHAAIKDHVQLCYDVCHFAVAYEDAAHTFTTLSRKGIKTGKIQISAALKSQMGEPGLHRTQIAKSFAPFNEPTYLHQVVAMQDDGSLKKYPDLPPALTDVQNKCVNEWRAHFHVPLFVADYGNLQSTQQDIIDVLALQKQHGITNHLEIETYTWEVLPQHLKLPLNDSIIRELDWVQHILNDSSL